MATRLAPETLGHVISYLHGDHRSVQRLTGVCRFWRAVVRDHPLYWRHIQIADVWRRPSYLDAFLSKIAYGAEHKPNVSIRITAECSRWVEGEHHEEAKRTSHTILKTVALHTHRLLFLKLTLGLAHLRFFADCHRETLLEFPCLEHLHLYLAMPLEKRMSYSGPPLLFPPFRAPRVTALVLFDMLPTNPGTLESLRLPGIFDFPVSRRLTQHLPQPCYPIGLQTQGAKGVSGKFIATSLLCGTGGLEVLSLHCHGIKAPQLSAILAPFPRIERLCITLGKGVHSHGNSVAAPAPILKHLSLVLFSCNSLSVLRSILRSTIPPSLKTFDYSHSTVGSVPTAPRICLQFRQPILFGASHRTEGIIAFATPDRELVRVHGLLLGRDGLYPPQYLNPELIAGLQDRLVLLRLPLLAALPALLWHGDVILPNLTGLHIETCGQLQVQFNGILICASLRDLALFPCSARNSSGVAVAKAKVDRLVQKLIRRDVDEAFPIVRFSPGVYVDDLAVHSCGDSCVSECMRPDALRHEWFGEECLDWVTVSS